MVMVRGETHQKKNENQTKGGFTGFSKAEEYLAPRAVGGTVGGSRRRGWPGGEHCPAHLRARGSSGNALVAVPGYGRAPRAISAGLRTRVRGLSCRHRRPLPGARRVRADACICAAGTAHARHAPARACGRVRPRRRHSTRATRAGCGRVVSAARACGRVHARRRRSTRATRAGCGGGVSRGAFSDSMCASARAQVVRCESIMSGRGDGAPVR